MMKREHKGLEHIWLATYKQAYAFHIAKYEWLVEAANFAFKAADTACDEWIKRGDKSKAGKQ